MDPDFLGGALGLPFLPCVLEVADQFLFLGTDGNHGISLGLVFGDRSGDVCKLRIPIFMLPTLTRLPGSLQAVFHLRQQVADGPLTDLMPLPLEFFRQSVGALAGPAQR